MLGPVVSGFGTILGPFREPYVTIYGHGVDVGVGASSMETLSRVREWINHPWIGERNSRMSE
jgi:hypothetical protein